MKILYLRDIYNGENITYQKETLYGYGAEKIVVETEIVIDGYKEQLETLLNTLMEGDVIVVYDLSVLAKSLKDLVRIMNIIDLKGAYLVSHKEVIDNRTETGKLELSSMVKAYHFQERATKEQKARGIDKAKMEGKYKGRKPIEIDEEKFWELYEKKIKSRSKEFTMEMFACELGISVRTLEKHIKRLEEERAQCQKMDYKDDDSKINSNGIKYVLYDS